jgi:hypothetical protein
LRLLALREADVTNSLPGRVGTTVVAYAGTHFPEFVVMDPRFRGDDRSYLFS